MSDLIIITLIAAAMAMQRNTALWDYGDFLSDNGYTGLLKFKINISSVIQMC